MDAGIELLRGECLPPNGPITKTGDLSCRNATRTRSGRLLTVYGTCQASGRISAASECLKGGEPPRLKVDKERAFYREARRFRRAPLERAVRCPAEWSGSRYRITIKVTMRSFEPLHFSLLARPRVPCSESTRWLMGKRGRRRSLSRTGEQGKVA